MYTGEDIQNKIAERKLNIIKGFVETDDILEKAKEVRQVGQTKVGSDGVTRVWTQLPNGKYDWRRKKASSDNKDDSKKSNNDLKLENLKVGQTLGFEDGGKIKPYKITKIQGDEVYFTTPGSIGFHAGIDWINKNKQEVKKISSDEQPKVDDKKDVSDSKSKVDENKDDFENEDKREVLQKRNNKKSLPSNIQEYLKGSGSHIKTEANKVNGWLHSLTSRNFTGGTAIGKHYGTLVLDITYQGGEVYINEDGTIKINGEMVNSKKEFENALKKKFKLPNEEIKKSFSDSQIQKAKSILNLE